MTEALMPIVAIDQPEEQRIRGTITILNSSIPHRIEMGTPVICAYGIRSSQQLASRFGLSNVHLDLKLADFPETIGTFIDADVTGSVTALAVMGTEVVERAAAMAENAGVRLYASLMGVHPGTVGQCVKDLPDEVDAVIAHGRGAPGQAFEQMMAQLDVLEGSTNFPLVAAGGIDGSNSGQLAGYQLAGIILGRAVTQSNDPKRALEGIMRRLA